MIVQGTEAAELRAELAEVVSALAEKTSPRSEVVERAESAAAGDRDETLWRRLVDEVGILGLNVAEDDGGAGASLGELSVICEILGARTEAVPVLGALAAVEVAKGTAPGRREELLASLMSGEVRGCVCLDAEVDISGTDSGPVLTGVLDRVVDAAGADVVFVCTRTADAEIPQWFAVQLADTEVTALRALDLVRSVATVSLDATPARPVEVEVPGALQEYMRSWIRVLVAAEQLGVAEQALTDSVSYVQLREQFGRVIGSFQAVKHMLADVAAENDLARSLLEHAVWAAVEEPDRLAEAAAMAMLGTSSAAVAATAENVQAHGGIGFSWEHPAHLLFRKARSNELLLQDRDVLVAEILGANGVAA